MRDSFNNCHTVAFVDRGVVLHDELISPVVDVEKWQYFVSRIQVRIVSAGIVWLLAELLVLTELLVLAELLVLTGEWKILITTPTSTKNAAISIAISIP